MMGDHWLDKVVELLLVETNDLRELARIAGGDPKTFYKAVSLQDLDIDGQDIEGMEFAPTLEKNDKGFMALLVPLEKGEQAVLRLDYLIAAIKQVGRQEERLALILKLILENYINANVILETYGSDKAKYASRVLAEMRRLVRDEEAKWYSLKDRLSSLRKTEFTNAIFKVFDRGMPSNRSAMLYFMSFYLAEYPEINDQLSRK